MIISGSLQFSGAIREIHTGGMQQIIKGRHENFLFLWSEYLVDFAFSVRNKMCFG